MVGELPDAYATAAQAPRRTRAKAGPGSNRATPPSTGEPTSSLTGAGMATPPGEGWASKLAAATKPGSRGDTGLGTGQPPRLCGERPEVDRASLARGNGHRAALPARKRLPRVPYSGVGDAITGGPLTTIGRPGASPGGG